MGRGWVCLDGRLAGWQLASFWGIAGNLIPVEFSVAWKRSIFPWIHAARAVSRRRSPAQAAVVLSTSDSRHEPVMSFLARKPRNNHDQKKNFACKRPGFASLSRCQSQGRYLE